LEITVSNKLRVLWIAPYPSKEGGHPAPWIVSLAKYIAKEENIELEILAPAKEVEEDFTKDAGIYKVHFVKIPGLKRDLLSFYTERIYIVKRWLRRNLKQYDLIHVHGTEHQYEHSVAGLNIPVIISLQGILYEYLKVLKPAINARYISWGIGSIYEKRGITRNVNFSGRTDWDYRSIKNLQPDLKYFKIWEMLRGQFYEAAGSFDYKKNFLGKNLLFVGGTNDIKGIREALLVLDKLIPKFSYVKMRIAGRVEKSVIEKIISKESLLQIKPNIHLEFTGHLDETALIRYMQDSFILFHPSWIDNSPNSICEAQMVGLPVLATDVGGVDSLVNHEDNGLLCELNAQEMLNQILNLARNFELYKKLSVNSSVMAAKRHDRKVITQSWLQAYESIIIQA
jgi:glycosyltransferase involved in cell wall biosynthesis